MMHGREKSDSAIVAGKPTNKAVPTAAEPVERRAKGGGRGECEPAKHGPGTEPDQPCHKRWSAYGEPPSAPHGHSPKAGAVCGNSARTDLSGLRRASALNSVA